MQHKFGMIFFLILNLLFVICSKIFCENHLIELKIHKRLIPHHYIWKEKNISFDLDTNRTCLIICDMWNMHRCIKASKKMKSLAERADLVIRFLREKNVKIIHAPAHVMHYYSNMKQRKNIKDQKFITGISPSRCRKITRNQFNFPVSSVEEGVLTSPPISATNYCSCHENCSLDYCRWCSLHDPSHCILPDKWHQFAHEIDLIDIGDNDVISDSGEEIYNFIVNNNINLILMAGVSLNMCVYDRSYGIKPLVERGGNVVLINDLCSVFQHPDLEEYLDLDKQNEIFIKWLQKFWCPSISSEELLAFLGYNTTES